MDSNKSIGALEALLFAINLEVMLQQMRILEISAERRFPERQVESKRKKQLRDKLTKDRRIIKEVIMRTLVELTKGVECFTVKQAVNMLEKNVTYVISLQTENLKLEILLDKINVDLQKNRQQKALESRRCDLQIASLRDNIRDTVSNTRIQLDYAERWLCAQTESLELKFQTNPAPAPKPENENCVHNELLRAYQLQLKEREDLLQHWMSRYVSDIANIESRLKDQCEKLRVTVARRQEMEKLYKLHEGEMRAWLTFKRERAARLAREERLRKAATRVQAWWRAVMVRRALGSFRYLRNLKKSGPKPKKK